MPVGFGFPSSPTRQNEGRAVPRGVVAHRRAKNRTARASRRHNRKG